MNIIRELTSALKDANGIIEHLRLTDHDGVENIDQEPLASAQQRITAAIALSELPAPMTQTPTDALRLVPRRAVHDWIRDDVPLNVKMTIMPHHIDNLLDRLSAAAPASPLPGGGWQDISTAPKDGTEILIYRDAWQEAPRAKWGDHDGENEKGESIVFGGWFMASEWLAYGCEDGFLGWNEDADVMPTHWMPLPAAPTGEPK